MRLKRKHKIIILISSIIVFIFATLISSYYILNGDKILRRFNIIAVTNDYANYKITFEKVKAAKYYKVVIYDQKNIKVFELKTKENNLDIELSNLEFGMSYELMVYAYNKSGDFRPAEKSHIFKWNEPSIISNNSIILNNKNYDLQIEGDLSNKDYEISILSNKKEVSRKKIKDNVYKINNILYKDQEVILTVNLIYSDKVISTINLYNNVNPISKIKITSPKKDEIINYNDVSFSFEGGSNVKSYNLKIYENSKLVKEAKINKNHVILSKKIFNQAKKYTLKIEGKLDKYTQTSEISFTMSAKEQLNPVYISNNWKVIKAGSKIELLSNNSEKTRIYYTLDGSNPESMGILYTKPITINKNVTLKAIAREDNMIDSKITSFDFNIGEKKNLTVYLSPSNQFGNKGVIEVGYTNERDEMNDLTNYIEERLKSFGVKVVRNNSSGNINLWLKESAYAGAELHLAIHSNASTNHDKYGIETWINSDESKTLSLASKIQNNLINIYPYRDKENANRGVKYAHEALGECNDNYIPFGILVEIAHHDYKNDAKWIMENKKLIGYNIADSILEYYQIIE